MSGTTSLEDIYGTPIALKSVHIDGKVDGLLATMAITQRYRNDSGHNLEIVYTFPLAWGATLLGMDVVVGGKRLQAVVMEKREAEERYENAIADGDAPVMVEQSAPGLYTANLGNIEDGEDVLVEIRYAQLLPFEQGRVRLSVPCVIAPRYGDQHRDGGLSPHENADADIFAKYPLTINITLAGQTSKALVRCPTHDFGMRETENGLTVVVNSGALLDRDFVLLLEEMAGRSHALLAPDAGKYMMLASFCPDVPLRAEPLRVKILVDCSGSMGGDSIAQARQALHHVFRDVTPKDYVSYSCFGDTVHHECGRLVPCSEEVLERLAGSIARTQADMGGTKMERALLATFSDMAMPEGDPSTACVLLITDGEIWDVEKVIRTARDSRHRVFAVGVGSAPAESLLRNLAEKTGGACELVSPNEDISAATARMFRRMRGARTQTPDIDWGGKPEWQSALPAQLYDGDTVYAFASFTEAPTRPPVLRWMLDGREEHLFVETIGRTDADAVAHLGGARRMAEAATREEAVELALRYQLVSKYSTLFLVHEREGEKSASLPALHQVPQMMAAGHGGFGSVKPDRHSDGLGAGPQKYAHESARSRRDMSAPAMVRPAGGVRIAHDDFEMPSLKRQDEPRCEASEAVAPIPGKFEALTPRDLLRAFQRDAADATNIAKVVGELIVSYQLSGVERAIVDISGKTSLRQEQVWALLLHWLADCFKEFFTLGRQAQSILQRELDAMPDADKALGLEAVAREFSGTVPGMWRIALVRAHMLQVFEMAILRGTDQATAARWSFHAARQLALEEALGDVVERTALPMEHARILTLFHLMERSGESCGMARQARRVLREAVGAYPHAEKAAVLEAVEQALYETPPETPETEIPRTAPAEAAPNAFTTTSAARETGERPMQSRKSWRTWLRGMLSRTFHE